jgi:hypothetical protein
VSEDLFAICSDTNDSIEATEEMWRIARAAANGDTLFVIREGWELTTVARRQIADILKYTAPANREWLPKRPRRITASYTIKHIGDWRRVSE